MATSLYVNHYADGSGARQAELVEALRRNLDNPHIDRVFVLESAPSVDHPKLKVIATPRRPTFRRYFEAVNEHSSAADLNIIANNDIYFDDSLGRVAGVALADRCLALTRWDVQPDGSTKFLGWNNSQDVWIFRGHVKAIDACDYCPGQPACDWRLAAELRRCGYELFNPSLDIRAHHLHLSRVRHYTNSDFVNGDHAEVEVGNVANIGSRPVAPGVISFSLFGDNRRYTVGAEENVLMARHVYPGWVCRFYVDATVPRACVDRLRGMGAQVVSMPSQRHPLQGMFWRFLVADDGAFERWNIRDADSRLGYRERRAVDEWIASGAPFHIMRDHPWHSAAVMGGAFGGVPGVIPDMAGKIRSWQALGYYGADQQFLAQVIYPLIEGIALWHDSFAESFGGLVRPFPTPYEDYRFVHERIYADGSCCREDREALIDALARRSRERLTPPSV
jgi:hypothetical protein